nr:WXG100 family type VII secretion target [Streptomyces sp. TLI_235]
MPANFNFVDTNAMRTAVGRFQETESGLQNVLRNVDSQLAVLTSGWTGEVAKQYQQLMVEWSTQFNRIYTDLGDMVNILNTSIRQYESGNSSNLQAIATMQSNFSL